jgi:HEAT repeat protein
MKYIILILAASACIFSSIPVKSSYSYYADIVQTGGSPEQVIEALNQLSYAGIKSMFWNYVKYLDYSAGEDQGGTAAYRVRKAAAEALGRLKDDRAIPYLIERFKKEKNNKVKSAILYGLSFYRSAAANPIIDESLTSQDDDIRYNAMITAVTVERKEAIPKIKNIFNSEKDAALKITECYALYALGDSPAENTKLLTEGLKDKDPVVRYRANDYIARLKIDSVVGDVLKALEIENRWWVRVEMDRTVTILYNEKRRKREEAEEKLFSNTYSSPLPKPEEKKEPAATAAPVKK